MKIHKMFTNSLKCYDHDYVRNLKNINYIVIHYTGNAGDTAKGNCNYFKNGNLSRYAGAHYFADGKQVWQSVPLNREAYSVGASSADKSHGGGKFYGKCKNSNSVSIELCDCLHGVTKKQAKLTKKLIKKIRKKCPNAHRIIRHWDVTGKTCPAPYVGEDNAKWKKLKKYLNGKRKAYV